MTLERLGVLDTLVARLAEVDAGAREKLLAAGQSGVVEILIGALEHEDPRVRYMIAEILGEVRNTAWLKQFSRAHDLEHMRFRSDIKNIAGATLSSEHVTQGVRYLVALWQTTFANDTAPSS